MEYRERLQLIVDTLFKGSRRAFALEIGVNPGTIDNVLGKRASKPSIELYEKILLAIGNIDAEWLLVGKNEMFKQSLGDVVDKQELNMLKQTISNLNSHISDLNKKIMELDSKKHEYEKLLGIESKLSAG